MRSLLKAGVIGIFVAILAVLPPVLHFITGPFGPLIGGFIGGTTVKSTPRSAIGIGACMGGVGVLACGAFLAVLQNRFFQDIQGILQVVGISVFVGIYIGLLGGLGALIASKLSAK